MGIQEDCLAALRLYVGFTQLYLAVTHRLDLAAHQRNAGFKPVFQEVVVRGAAVGRDDLNSVFGGFGHQGLLTSWIAASSSGSLPSVAGSIG